MSTGLQRIEARVPGFLPSDWRGRGRRSGDALLHVAAHFADLVEEAAQLAPDKDFLAFLDALGLTLLPALPARAPIVFTIAADAPADVNVPAGTQVAATLPPPLPTSIGSTTANVSSGGGTPIVFTTDSAIALARASFADVHSLLPAEDRLADHSQALTSGFEFFPASPDIAPSDLVDHELYLGADTLLGLPPTATVTLLVGVADLAATALKLTWEYYTASGWIEFLVGTDQTHGLVTDGGIVLLKLAGPPAAVTTVNGTSSYWIRARTNTALQLPGSQGSTDPLPSVETIALSVSHEQGPLPLDAALANGISVDTTKDFAPFGQTPTIGSALAIACDAAFGQAGAQLSLQFHRSQANLPPGSSPDLVWEYSSSSGVWKRVETTQETALSQGGPWGPPPSTFKDLFTSDSRSPEWRRIAFDRPVDWARSTLNGQSHYWLRVRLANLGYGGPPTWSGGQVSNPYNPPVTGAATAAYTLTAGPQPIDHAILHNRFDWRDVSEAARWGRAPFQPFQPVPDTLPALYFGFTAPLPVGLVSLLAAGPAVSQSVAPPASSPFTWEYRSPAGWSELAVLDEAGGFTQTGMVQFIGPPDLVADSGPGQPLYWVRARLKASSSDPEPLPMQGLYFGAVWATNRTPVSGEALGPSDGAASLTVQLQHPLVLPGQTILVQEWTGTGDSWQSLLDDVPTGDLTPQIDASGQVTAVWVTWHEQPNLYTSGPRDRSYTIDRTQGTVRFGDDTAGMIPPAGSPISASYQYGGGSGGNVGTATISQLLSALPSVLAVSNPLPASGGSDAEQLPLLDAPTAAVFAPPANAWRAGVRARGPQELRHRGRSLSASDYEWLARDASTEVAVASCLPATGPDGPRPGWVTVIVAPVGADDQPQPSLGLLDTVREHLAACAPAAIASQIQVSGPSYEPVSVFADVIVDDPGAAAVIEQNLRSALDTYLHPVRGGGAAGWRFGDTVHLSPIAELIESVDGVNRVTALQLSAGGSISGDALPLEPGRLPCSGRHTLLLQAGS